MLEMRKKLFWILINAVVTVILYFYFARFFSGELKINPVAFSVGSLIFYWYGILVTLGIVLGYFLLWRRAEKFQIDRADLPLMVVLLIIFGLLGGRLGYVLQNLGYFRSHLGEIISIWQGGLTFYSAVAAGIVVACIIAKRWRINVWRLLDFFSPALLLALAVGRLGNFFNQELYGYPTNVAWKMFVAPEYRVVTYKNLEYFHPVFLYETILVLLALWLILWQERKFKIAGQTFLLVLGGYALVRFVVEFFRIGEKIFLGLTLGQIISAVIFIICTAIFVLQLKLKRRSPQAAASMDTTRD